MKLKTAMRREIEVGREDISYVEVRKVRVPPFRWATHFYFIGGDGKRALHYFVAYRTSALRSAFESFGYTIADTLRQVCAIGRRAH